MSDFGYFIFSAQSHLKEALFMSKDNKDVIKSKIKFCIHLFIAMVTLSILITCLFVAFKLFQGGISYDVLKDVGLFFIVGMTICLASGSLFYLYTYIAELCMAVSTYRFYKALTGTGSYSLLVESYHSVIKTFNAPIQAKHIDGNGNSVYGQWNGIGDWSVYDIKTTKKFSGDSKWVKPKESTTSSPQ